MLKKFIACIISAIMLVSMVQITAQAASAARIITVFRIHGRNATLYRDTGQSFAPRANTRIGSGFTITTGLATNIYLRMDQTSILKMDAETRITTELTNDNISLNIETGTALVKVTEQSIGNTIETSLGNVALTVRGTLFTLGYSEDDFAYIAMLSGSGEVGNTILQAGDILLVHQVLGDYIVEVEDIQIDQLDQFTLREIINNQEYLLENSDFITQDIIDSVPNLLEEEYVSPETPQRSWNDAQARQRVANANRRIEDARLQAERRNNQIENEPIAPVQPPTAPITPTPPQPPQPPQPTPMPPYPDPERPTGEGTASSPFQIADFAELDWVRIQMITDFSYRSKYYQLNSNIQLYPDWQGFRAPFNGNFNGNGHHISGWNSDFGGLFSIVEGTIENLTVYGNVNVDTASTASRGGFADYLRGGTLENVGFIGNVTNYGGTAGGLVGELSENGTIRNASVDGNIRAFNVAGGIVGRATSSHVALGNFYGTVYSENDVAGGIVGHLTQDSQITASAANATITSANNGAGGIVGWMVGSRVMRTASEGNIHGVSAGGIVGQTAASEVTLQITDSYSTANVTGSWGAGGIVGTLQTPNAQVRRVYATGEIRGTSNAGAILGVVSGSHDNTADVLRSAAAANTFIQGNNTIVGQNDSNLVNPSTAGTGALEAWFMRNDLPQPQNLMQVSDAANEVNNSLTTGFNSRTFWENSEMIVVPGLPPLAWGMYLDFDNVWVWNNETNILPTLQGLTSQPNPVFNPNVTAYGFTEFNETPIFAEFPNFPNDNDYIEEEPENTDNITNNDKKESDEEEEIEVEEENDNTDEDSDQTDEIEENEETENSEEIYETDGSAETDENAEITEPSDSEDSENTEDFEDSEDFEISEETNESNENVNSELEEQFEIEKIEEIEEIENARLANLYFRLTLEENQA